jgi:DNA-binding transcriptional LysR family regulator
MQKEVTMEIRNLITFQKIYDMNSFSKAANELGYSQSTVTMQMKQLEAELQVKLFDRIGKTISITNEGERFLKYANDIITASNNAIAELTTSNIVNGEIRIGILESVCSAYLPQILSNYHKTYPEVSTIIQTGTFDDLAAKLNSNRIDLLWTYDTPIEAVEWEKAFEYESPISVVCSNEHPLARKDHVSVYDISEETFLLTEKNCSYRKIFVNHLQSFGITPKIFLEIGNTEIIKKFVEADLGIAVLPYFTLLEELGTNKLKVIKLNDYQLMMQGQLFYHKNKWRSPALNLFIQLVKDSHLI